MTLAADHSTAGAIIGGTLKRDGFSGVIRYAAAGRTNVNITAAEVRDLRANGLEIAIVLEHEGRWLLNTATIAARVAGSRDVTRAAGLPDGMIYMAADFDATNGGPTFSGSVGDRQMTTIAQSLKIAAEVIGRNNVGFYGSAWAIIWLQAHGWGDLLFWQTAAWSQRVRSKAASLFQRAQSMNVAGVDVDVDDILKTHWGQRVAAPPQPVPKLSHDQRIYNEGFQRGFAVGWKARAA